MVQWVQTARASLPAWTAEVKGKEKGEYTRSTVMNSLQTKGACRVKGGRGRDVGEAPAEARGRGVGGSRGWGIDIGLPGAVLRRLRGPGHRYKDWRRGAGAGMSARLSGRPGAGASV